MPICYICIALLLQLTMHHSACWKEVSKFKLGNFPWTFVLAILVSQGLVMWGWPALVSMPGDWGGTSKAKGISHTVCSICSDCKAMQGWQEMPHTLYVLCAESPSSGSNKNLAMTAVLPVHIASGVAPQHTQPTLLAPSIVPQAPGIADSYQAEHGEWADLRRQQLGGISLLWAISALHGVCRWWGHFASLALSWGVTWGICRPSLLRSMRGVWGVSFLW